MKSEEQIIRELAEIKQAIVRIAGTSELPKEEQFSVSALDKAAVELKKLAITRGEWIQDRDLSRYFKGVYNGGKFIRETFGFNDYFTKGKSYYYRKSSILRLSQELKSRNVDLARYMELKESEAKFQEKVAAVKAAKKKEKTKSRFLLPDSLKDITTDGFQPPIEQVETELKQLQKDFINENLSKYIDVYGRHAMLKFRYPFSGFVGKEIKSRCKRWCDQYNMACQALSELTGKQLKFSPPENPSAYEL
ncbi:hypothetical protein [Dyadobacter sp. CY351]|uniref:hypothetical protein n=1 Tax=Dyadobacter sp. CY351 TaxID=2909337 RepID=UPI001F454CB1|nr:hypothetical protein [Dyadobacter sp. CY351]MCF2520068.1 hypothetical protein [Dyadobacter sp. CY351]